MSFFFFSIISLCQKVWQKWKWKRRKKDAAKIKFNFLFRLFLEEGEQHEFSNETGCLQERKKNGNKIERRE